MPSDGRTIYGIALLHRRYSSVLDITDSMPECVVRQRRLYADILLRDRMDELDTVAQQADAAVRIGTRRTILQVALYRAVHIGQLAADLMMAARHEVDFQQCVTVRPVDYLVMQNGFLGRRHLVVVSIALVLPLVAHKPVGQCRLRFERRTRDNRPIGLVYLAIAEHIVQPRERLGGLGKNDQPRYRPVSGLVIFAKTSKALARLNNMFRNGEVHKTYWAIVTRPPFEPEATLTDWLVRNERQNKSYAYNHQVPTSKKSILHYKIINRSDRYTLLEINLMTGRHHQIRCQLSNMDCPIKGDLKYGAPRSNPDGSISLLSHRVEFVHPVSKENICIESPLPDDTLWHAIGNVQD